MMVRKSLWGQRFWRARRKSGRRSRRTRPGARRVTFQQLEDRRLLTTQLLGECPDVVFGEGEGHSPQVAIHLIATDPSGRPISQVRTGEEFVLLAVAEDLRAVPSGVFAAYFDVTFAADLAAVGGPIDFVAGFENGQAGTVDQPGLIDDVGAFRNSLSPPGVAISPMFTVPVVANTVGELVFETDPADDTGHEVLLYGVDAPITIDRVEFGRVGIVVVAGGGGSQVDAVNDSFDVLADSGANRLDVLRNDVASGGGSLTVAEVNSSGIAGSVSIAADAASLLYTPAAGFVGREEFRYVAANADGVRGEATVTVQVNSTGGGDDVVAVRLQASDALGRPLTAVASGEQFLLQAFVEDVRSDPQGVFAAYMDVSFASQHVRPSGPIVYGGAFGNGQVGDVETPGVVNEVGAFQGSLTPPGGGEFLVFSLAFVAGSPGHAVFQSDPADSRAHDVLVYGSDAPVDTSRIDFGGAVIEVLPAVIAVDDSFTLPEDTTVELDVLANDVNRSSTALLTIVEVDARGLAGTVEIAADKGSLVYTPAAGFGGTEQFTYSVAGDGGVDTAQVTIHTQPGAAGDDQLAILLAATDLAGNPITSIVSGEAFLLAASIQDLRSSSEANRGVFAAYFDLLYDRRMVALAAAAGNRLGFDVEFGADYQNGQQGSAVVPGIIDEVGAFQTGAQPLGTGEFPLFQVKLTAATSLGESDAFVVSEDSGPVALDVLANDRSTSGRAVFRADPSDRRPASDVLLFDPVTPVEPAGIQFSEIGLDVVSAGAPTITHVGPTSHGGQVVISPDGRQLLYTPAADFFGVETFSYTIDGSAAVAVEVVVEGVDDAPRAADDAYRVRGNRTLRVDSAEGLLANDVEVDGDQMQVAVVEGPAHGSLQFERDGAFVYVPDRDYIGPDRFHYRATDGALESELATVEITVEPPPVRIRLEITDLLGAPLTTVAPGQPFLLRVLVRDMRSDLQPYRGVGAVYLDVAYDDALVSLVASAENSTGFAVDFADAYQNGTSAGLDLAGLLDDLGAFQTGLVPTGAEEIELVSVEMEAAGLFAEDDAYRVSMDSHVNVFDVLANELGLTRQVEFDAGPSGNSPVADIVLFEPPMAVGAEDVAYQDAAVQVSNGVDLTIVTAGPSQQGGSVRVVDGGQRLHYAPPAGFVGVDTFSYTVSDDDGNTAEAQVTVEVAESWQNLFNRFDVNSDGFVTSADVLLLVNELNRNGARALPLPYAGPYFFDVNGDGFLSPQDVLLVLNEINGAVADGAGEGEPLLAAPAERPAAAATPALPARQATPRPPLAASLVAHDLFAQIDLAAATRLADGSAASDDDLLPQTWPQGSPTRTAATPDSRHTARVVERVPRPSSNDRHDPLDESLGDVLDDLVEDVSDAWLRWSR